MAMLPLAEVAAHYRRMVREMPLALERDVRVLMEGVAKEAKAMLGEEHPEWPDLAASTITDKIEKGFDVPSPLRRTGALQDSIESRVEVAFNNIIGEVGSDLPYAEDQENGRAGQPPRPFLSTSMIKAEPVIGEALGRLAQRSLNPGEVP